MSRRYAPATEGEMDRLMLVAPVDAFAHVHRMLPVDKAAERALDRAIAARQRAEPTEAIDDEATSRALTEDEDDGLTSSRRAETLHRLGVITIRRR